jgi:site-specific DNA recombinase
MTQLRAVIYARYSSDLQREASIEDQLRICRERASREGWTIVDTYTDIASSGSNSFRKAYKLLHDQSRLRKFDIVLAESLDRLSRDQEDIAALYKEMCFNRIQIVTLADGVVNELHVGLKGTMNALFLKDLAAKTHRGMRGRVENGRSAGGICFGYRVRREFNHIGEAIRGGRDIDPDQAKVINRIFELFAAGHSPKAIARKLNGENQSGPNGRDWRDTTIRGHCERGTGILRNELYIGRLVWNRQSYVRDPSTGRRLSRPNPKSEWIVEAVPELRLVSQDLWDRCAERLGEIAESPTAQALKKSQFWLKRRPKGLLSGLVRCGTCGGAMVTIGKDYLRCGNAHRNAGCSRTTSVRSSLLEGAVVDGLKEQLMQPELVEEFRLAFNQHILQHLGTRQAEAEVVEHRLQKVSQQINGLVSAIADGLRGASVQTRLNDLEHEKDLLTRQLQNQDYLSSQLPQDLASLYRAKVTKLEEAFHSSAIKDEATQQLRSLVEQIVVKGTKAEPEYELIGELAHMIVFANNKNATPEGVALQTELMRSAKVVAGARFELTTFRL